MSICDKKVKKSLNNPSGLRPPPLSGRVLISNIPPLIGVSNPLNPPYQGDLPVYFSSLDRGKIGWVCLKIEDVFVFQKNP